MMDMHLHTYYSDGTLSPAELVTRAANRGIKILAITDHDGLNGIAEALDAGKRFGVKIIPGIELSAIMSGGELNEAPSHYRGSIINMHILGYDIDTENEELNKAVSDIRKKRDDRNKKLLIALNEIGLEISAEDLIQRKNQDYVGKPNFALALVKRGYVKTARDANQPGMFLKHPEVRKIRREKIHVREAISLIKNAGGYAVLAHPMKVKFPDTGNGHEDVFEQLGQLSDQLQKWGLDGMECYYSSHTKEQTDRLVTIAKNRGLLITSGSDFHGPDIDPDLDVGMTGMDLLDKPDAGVYNSAYIFKRKRR